MAAFIHSGIRRAFIIGALALMFPAVASAQATDWNHGSALTLFGGAAVPNDNLRIAAGGSIAWEFTPRLSFDAMGVWFSPAHQDDVVFGSVGVRYALMGGRSAAPYLSAGVGLYRASFHMGPQAEMPSTFYGRRMQMRMDSQFVDGRQTFDDFAMRFGGGAEFFAGRHVSIRPEVQVIIVTDRHDAEVVPLFGLHLAYHFESHPITPNRR